MPGCVNMGAQVGKCVCASVHLHPWVEAGPAVPRHPLAPAGRGNGGAEPWVVTQAWLFWGPSWKQPSGQS